MKIIVCGNTNIPHSSENSVIRELVRQGHTVTPFDYPTLTGTNYNEINQLLFKELSKKDYDFALMSKCMGLNSKILKFLKNKFKIPFISWTFDLMKGYKNDYRLEWYLDQAPHWDVAFGAEAGSVEYYRSKGINYHALKIGADNEWHKKNILDGANHYNLRCDVSFVGDVYNGLRIGMDSKLKTMGVDYKVFNKKTLPVYMNDLPILANVCDISIGCNYRNDIPGYWSKRIYELMSSGLFMINAYVNGMEEEGFKHKENTVFFYDDDFDEMEDLIKYYLDVNNFEEYQRIVSNGVKLIRSKHMMSNRVDKFFEILKKEGVII